MVFEVERQTNTYATENKVNFESFADAMARMMVSILFLLKRVKIIKKNLKRRKFRSRCRKKTRKGKVRAAKFQTSQMKPKCYIYI